MKLLVLVAVVISSSMAQRPTYAGSRPIGRPELASRFKDPSEDSSTTVSLVNRVGEEGSTAKIPVDARGDAVLVDRLNQWPREHRPFWLLNSDAIEAARNPQSGQDVQTRFGEQETRTIKPTEQRSSFLGAANTN